MPRTPRPRNPGNPQSPGKPNSPHGTHDAPHDNPSLHPRPSRGGRGGHPGGPSRRPDATEQGDAVRARYLGRDVRIVYEDADVLVVDKPAGLLSTTLPGQSAISVFNLVKDHVRGGRGGKGGRGQRGGASGGRAWVIHRLDREASGLLVFAKTERAFGWLKEELRTKRTNRYYAAVVEGEVPDALGKPAAGVISGFVQEVEPGRLENVPIGEVTRARKPQAARGRPDFDARDEDDEPKLAVTHWRVLAKGRGHTLLQLKLDTGRKNQIRVHMQQFGRPIVGDRKYGASADPVGRVCLHAMGLGFSHPADGRPMRFTSPLPPSFAKLIGQKGETFTTQAMDTSAGDNAADGTGTRGAHASESRETRTTRTTQAAGEQPAPRSHDEAAGWDHVANWYDDLIERRRGDHQQEVIYPGVLRLLEPRSGMRVLDVACGQGALSMMIARQGAAVLGVDAAPRLIDAANARAREVRADAAFVVDDARELSKVEPSCYDAAACVMALMNIEPLEPAMHAVARTLKPGGRFVWVILHPAFRAPGQTSWGWDSGKRDGPPPKQPREKHERTPRRDSAIAELRQFRRVDGYLTHGQAPIVMNPGFAAHGKAPVSTWTFHRPLQTYSRALANAGFAIELIEEWASLRRSQPGPRAAEEDRARREIPLFLAVRARLLPRA